MKFNILILGLLFANFACRSQPDLSKLTLQQWQEDLHYFTEHAPSTHVNLYHTLSKADFDARYADLQSRLPGMSADQIVAEMVRWVAAIGDGHSHLVPEGSHSFPLHLFWFKEGLFLINGMSEAAPLVGWQLTHIEGVAVEIVAQKIEPYQHHDNAWQIRAQAPVFLASAEALIATGVLKNREQASFTLRNPANGEEKTISLRAKERRSLYHQMHTQEPLGHSLYRQKQNEKYWFTWLPESKILYFQYNEMRENEKQPIAEFLKKLEEAIRQNPVEKLVIDLRWNGGGNLFTSTPVVDFITRNPKINQKGKLFVLIGRNTFSAASWFVTALEMRSKAIFVGEPTGASPNHYGDTAPLRLPNSGLAPRLSTIFWQNSFPWDNRNATMPDVTVEPSAANWFADRDAALEAVIAFPLGQTLPTGPAISPLVREKLAGRYLMNDGQLLEILDQQERLSLRVKNFIQTDLYATTLEERFSADVRSLFISSAGEGKILLEAMGGKLVLEKLPSGYLLPGELIEAGDITGGIAAYRALFNKNPKTVSVSETNLNTFGYELAKSGHPEAALAVFQLNTELYPQAFNTWDSLGEWHMLHGEKQKAIEYYEKSVALNPQNENGKKMLKKLK